MTLTIRKQTCQPVERLKLSKCLRLLGVRPDRKKHSCSRPSFRLNALRDDGRLWDLYEAAKRGWLKLVKRHRPDLAHADGAHREVSIWINLLWEHTKKLFRRRGLEIA